ncbi:MAG TPA: glycoside hydrolase family 38 C-terminal domain-containing protein, partial [Candidatus Obscuribacterales bacterium]
MSKGRELCLYLHTHWDREWYLPYETFRTQLVSVVRQVLDELESGDLPSFLLDGQSLILEDVTEVDPSLARRIKSAMASGKLSAGPWYVLADQMLVGGESLIRNLQIGLEVASAYGAPCMVGYCPDTFGHSYDLPRLLQGFGIQTAFAWRGVPDLKAGPLFFWQSADGSKVLAYHLHRGYYQTLFHSLHSPEEIAQRLSPWLEIKTDVLVPVGADHIAPPVRFARVLSETEQALRSSAEKEVVLSVLPLETFADRLVKSVHKSRAIAIVDGELRDNAATLKYERAYMLQGVLSSRLYLKRANREQELRITRLIEPLLTTLGITGVNDYPLAELRHAWKLLLQNHPHDSICGCSVDEVHLEMVTRTKRFHHVLDAVEKEAAEAIAASGEGVPVRFARGENMVADPAAALDRLNVFNLSRDYLNEPVRFQWAVEPGEEAKHLKELLEEASIQLSRHLSESYIFTATGEEPVERKVAMFEGWVWADRIPPFAAMGIDWNGSAAKNAKWEMLSHGVETAARKIQNQFMQVEIEQSGDLSVNWLGAEGKGRKFNLKHFFRDVADAGDTYNFDPVAGDIAVVSQLAGVKEGQKGPLVGSLLLQYEIAIPESAVELPPMEEASATPKVKPPSAPGEYKRSKHLKKHLITTEIILKKGVPILFFETAWDNQSRDHRLEVVFDTGQAVDETVSENHFSVVRRAATNRENSLPVELGHEAPIDRFPCQRFFITNDQLFLNKGLPEYGVNGSEVCLTVLRAVSRLSRPRLRSRGGGAGPSLSTPGANCLGKNFATYGWAPLSYATSYGTSAATTDDDKQVIAAYQLSEQFEGRAWMVLGRGLAAQEGQSLLHLSNDAIRISALYQSQKQKVVVRLLNVTGVRQECSMTIGFEAAKAFKCRLDGNVIAELAPRPASQYMLDFKPYELTTLIFDVR